MSEHDIIIVGASAGGVEALKVLAAQLPESMPASLFVVLHVPEQGPSVLPDILNQHGKLRALHPQDSDIIQPGLIYIAPPGHHMTVEFGRVRIHSGPKENGYRPAIDPLLRSAARAYSSRVAGVILSGTLDDGTAGMLTVKRVGGITIVQDPDDAMFAGMPQSVINHVDVDYILPLSKIPDLLVCLAQQQVPGETFKIANHAKKGEMSARTFANVRSDHSSQRTDRSKCEDGAEPELSEDLPGKLSGFTCPECHGALWEIHDNTMVRFRCRVGHAYAADSLLAAQSISLEAALWMGLRALEEKVTLAHRLTARAKANKHIHAEAQFREHAEESERQIQVIRQVLQSGVLSAVNLPGSYAITAENTQGAPIEH